MAINSTIEDILNRLKERANTVPEDLSKYSCQKCKDTEFIISKDENGIDRYRKCECVEAKVAQRLLNKSGISEEFQTKTFNNFDDRGLEPIKIAKYKAIEYFKRFSDAEHDRINSILLCGQVGSGKTHLGMALANNLIKTKKVAVIYMEYRQAATRLKQLITDDYDYNMELDKYKRARVLFIDDMLKGKVTEADINLLYEIVNYRYLNKLPMIISTEKTKEELINFDEAIASRIIEMSKGNIIELTGKELNYRLYGL